MSAVNDLQRMEQMLLRMKDTSELMVDLAYSALLYNNKEIAQEVYHLEEITDGLYNKIQHFAVAQIAKQNATAALTVIRLATSIEMIGDSARGIADVVLREIEPHPIVRLSILESDVIISKVVVRKNSNVANCTLGSMRIASETGMWVIAIRRGSEWLFGPDENTKILSEDILIVRGPRSGEKSLCRLARPARTRGLIHRHKK